jgi:hypothetical protein
MLAASISIVPPSDFYVNSPSLFQPKFHVSKSDVTILIPVAIEYLMDETEDENSICPFFQIKTEVKTEADELCGKTGGSISSECSEHFFYEVYFVEHTRKHRLESKLAELADNNVDTNSVKDSASNKVEIFENTKPYNPDDMQGSPQFAQGQCESNEETTALLKNPKNDDNNNKPFKCSECFYASRKKHDLVRHLQIHNNERPFRCCECSFATRYKSSLIVHLLMHANEKPFLCSECSFATRRKYCLTKHLRTHTSEKPFKCPECSFAARQKGGLTKHMRYHANEKPFRCSECSFAARRKGNLTRHYKQSHTNK